MRPNQKTPGLTLVEVLIALFILSVCLLPVLKFLDINVMGGEKVKELRMALNFATEEMERLKNDARPESALQDEERHINTGKSSWRIKRDVVEGTDPLEVYVRVYKENEPSPRLEIFTMREDLKW